MSAFQSKSAQHDIDGDEVKVTLAPGDHENHREWIVLRMLIPTCANEKDSYDMGHIKDICEWTKASITIHEEPNDSDVAIVMICAEQKAAPYTSVVRAFLSVHDLFLERLKTPSINPQCSTRLLVPIEQARSLIVNNIINAAAKETNCCIHFHLMETVSIMSNDDVILEVYGMIDSVYQAVLLIVSHMVNFPVNQKILPELKDQVVAAKIDTHLSNLGTSMCKGESAESFPPRRCKVQRFTSEFGHSRSISPTLVGHIIGYKGTNMRHIWETCSAAIVVTPARDTTENIMTIGIYYNLGTERGRGRTSEVKRAEKLMQEFITTAGGPPSFFKSVLSGSWDFIPTWCLPKPKT